MAVMWPRQLQSWVLQDPRRSAECDVYRTLASTLGSEWSVFYSRPWWGISQRGSEIDGESDFVLAHPEHGVLFLEVKGGLIAYDPTADQWTSTDRTGIRHNIKDPARQAMASKHNLLRKFRESRKWPSWHVRLRHGVVFPHCDGNDQQLIGSYPRRLFCCSTEFRDAFRLWIESRLAGHVEPEHADERGPGREGIRAIDETLAAPARLTVPLHRHLTDDVLHQESLLTGAQLTVIHGVAGSPRAVIDGGAGTGKTIIAAELANRYARAGRSTLLCCRSDALVAMLRDRIGALSGLDVITLAEVAAAQRQGRLQTRDAVIVDEGQDVELDQWDAIERLITADGVLRVMFDSNQAVYRARDDLETRLGAKSYPLRVNLRNTQRIARITDGLYRGPLIAPVGPQGQPTVIMNVSADHAADRAAQVVVQLIRDEKLQPGDIAVLAATTSLANSMKGRLLTGRLAVTDALTRATQAVVVDTIATFKGLEALAVVLLVDATTANNQELCYVGVSRARALLIVVGPITNTRLGAALAAAEEL
jgi:hypothetical protein